MRVLREKYVYLRCGGRGAGGAHLRLQQSEPLHELEVRAPHGKAELGAWVGVGGWGGGWARGWVGWERGKRNTWVKIEWEHTTKKAKLYDGLTAKHKIIELHRMHIRETLYSTAHSERANKTRATPDTQTPSYAPMLFLLPQIAVPVEC